MSNRGGLAVYVTSHGFGHLNRTVAVLNRIAEDVPIVIRCKPDLFGGWRERLIRPASFEAHESDSGAINPPGDSVATDGPATLRRAREAFARAMAGLDREIATLRDEGTAAVLSDAPPMPLLAARGAGVPGFLLANFTWADIYESHARKIGAEAISFVAELRSAYRATTLLFKAQPSLAMRGVAKTEDVGLVVNPAMDRSDELRRILGLSRKEKLVYFYVGRYGQADLGWDRLARMDGVHFVGFHPAPKGRDVPNLHVVPASEWTGADLAASADAVVAKAGYGTVSEAMASRTPLIYPPRVGFAEHRALDRALKAWGGGVPASSRAFSELRLEAHLRDAFARQVAPPPFPVDGAERVARRVVDACRSGRSS